MTGLELPLATIVALVLAAFVAGWVDSIVGGGGLIQVPALFTALPQHAPATLFGTNKIASIAGTSMAARNWADFRAASASVASRAIVPMQDVLGLGCEARMNRPGVAEGSWTWRFDWAQVAPWHAELLADLARVHGRAGRRRSDRDAHRG